MSQYNIRNSFVRTALLAEYMQSRFERRPEGPRPEMAQDPISGILLPTDENIGSRMKTCLSIIDSYDEIMKRDLSVR